MVFWSKTDRLLAVLELQEHIKHLKQKILILGRHAFYQTHQIMVDPVNECLTGVHGDQPLHKLK